MLPIKHNEEATCGNCGSQTTKPNLARHKKRCSRGTLSCNECPNSSTMSQVDWNYFKAEKHPRGRAKNTYKCKICLEGYFVFYALQKHSSSQHGIPIRISSLDMDTLLEDTDDAELKEILNSCNQFLVDSELGKRRHSGFHFARSSFNNSFLNGKRIMCSTNGNFEPKSTWRSDLY